MLLDGGAVAAGPAGDHEALDRHVAAGEPGIIVKQKRQNTR
jgi:hypothetical protein